MIDLHCHTNYGGHSEGSLIDCISSASQKGIKILGFSEHFPLPHDLYDIAGSAMSRDNLQIYIYDIEDIKKTNNLLEKVLLGFETDYLPAFKDETKRKMEKIDYDYLIGSVHFMEGWSIDFSDEEFRKGLNKRYGKDLRWSAKMAVNEYFSLVKEMIDSDLFQIVGHLDLIKKFNPNSAYFNEFESHYKNWVNTLLDFTKKKGMALEINSSGFDKPIKEQYPSRWIVEQCCSKKIPVTLGSDAHKPEEIARHFEKTIGMIKETGCKEIAYFENKNMIMREI